jgi:CHAT domain-containing protein
LRASLFGTETPQYGRVLLALAQLEIAPDAYGQAAQLFHQAAARLRGQLNWQDMLEAAEFGSACAAIRLDANDAALERARAIVGRAAERRGRDHPTIGSMRRNLALHLTRSYKFQAARDELEEGDRSARFALIEALESQADADLGNVVQPLRDFQELHLSLLATDPSKAPESVRRAYEMLIGLRGAETTILRLRGRSSLQSSVDSIQQEVQRLKRAIVQLELRGDPGRSSAHAAADIARYRQQLETVEAQLVDRVAEFRLDLEFLEPALPMIAQELPSDTALLEYATFTKLVAEADPLDGPRHYAAFVVRKGVEGVQFFDLGPADAVDSLIDEFRTAVITQPRRRMNRDEVGWRAPGEAVYGRLVKPLVASLTGIQKLIIVPDAKIGVLPIGSLPVSGDRFLIDAFEVSYRFSSHGLGPMRYEEDFGVEGKPVVLGAPDYGARSGAKLEEPLEDDAFLAQFRSGSSRFEPLAEAADECREIARLFDVPPRLGKDAAEGELKTLANPEILHISTHGFFLEKSTLPDTESKPAVSGRAALDDPLDRAGLAFSGANAYLDGDQLPPGAEDGILYASEVAGLNLMRTDLVTLSACQTGLGDVRSGDGVHGLQRAFTAAGARSVVCSLWEVPDRPTRILFTRFYEEIRKKRLRSEALQTVVRELARQYPLNPIAWGGFALYGDRGVLTRFDPIRQLSVASVVLDSRRPPPESPAQKAERLIAEGRRLFADGDSAKAIAVFTEAFELEAAPLTLRARGLYERAGVQRQATSKRRSPTTASSTRCQTSPRSAGLNRP